MTLQWRKVGVARPALGDLINAAFHGKQITILQIGKNDRAAIVPLDMVPEYAKVMGEVPPPPADTMVEDVQRSTSQGNDAHSQAAFDEQLDDQLADLLSGADDDYDGQEHIEDE